jgi:hypothetical protein
MQWYKVTVYRGHRGAGRTETEIGYCYREDIIQVIKGYKTLPGVKRSCRRNFPDIFPLSEEESITLEKRLMNKKDMPIEVIRKRWHFPKIE